MFAVAVEEAGTIVGVAIANRPTARMLAADPYSLEVTRTCTLGTRNANSMLYGAIARAAKALGYHKLYTYTLTSETGASLKAAGWVEEKELKATAGWSRPSRPRYEANLFGDDQDWGRKIPTGENKVRWTKHL